MNPVDYRLGLNDIHVLGSFLLDMQLKMVTDPVLTFHKLKIDIGSHRIHYNGQEVFLTPKEYALFCLLAINAGKVLTYQALYETVWNEDSLDAAPNVVACYIYNIRKKFQRISVNLTFTIRCVWEAGYCFEEKEL